MGIMLAQSDILYDRIQMIHTSYIPFAEFSKLIENDSVDEYIDLVIDYIEHLRPDLVLERFVSQSPKELLIAPDWGVKNYEFTEKVKKRMRERNAWQVKYYKP